MNVALHDINENETVLCDSEGIRQQTVTKLECMLVERVLVRDRGIFAIPCACLRPSGVYIGLLIVY